nr:DNA methyltransferase [Microcystis aeruginosa]
MTTAVFSIELCNLVIKFYSYKGDLVFDSFGGRGTVGKTARNLGRYFFLTEQESTYVDRMKIYLGQPMLFEPKLTKFLSLAEFFQLSQEQEYDNNH